MSDQLVELAMTIAVKKLSIKNISGSLGVRGRNPVLSRSSEPCPELSEWIGEEEVNGLAKKLAKDQRSEDSNI